MKKIKLDDIAINVTDVINLNNNFKEIKYLDTSNITSNYINNLLCLVKGKDEFPSRAKKKVKHNDIIYSTVRPKNNHHGILKNPTNNLIVSTAFAVLRVNEKEANPNFIYEYIIQKKITNFMHSLGEDSQSSFPAINPKDLLSLEIDLPSKKYQDNISIFSQTIQSKIENNKNLIKNLTELSFKIFDSWFINFETFTDRSKFKKTNIGYIPKDWSTDLIGNRFNVTLGGTPSRKNRDYWDGSIGWINSGEINNLRIIQPTEYITKKGLEKSSTKILPKRTTLIAITGATLGQVSINEIEICANQSVVGISTSNNIPPEYIYLWVKFNITKIISSETGGAQQHINKDDISNSEILIPSKEILNKFEILISPIFDKISTTLFENKKLMHLKENIISNMLLKNIQI